MATSSAKSNNPKEPRHKFGKKTRGPPGIAGMTIDGQIFSGITMPEQHQYLERKAMAADRKTASDASIDPWDRHNRSDGSVRDRCEVGALIPQQDQLSRDELYATSLTPSGQYITDIAPRNALRAGWEWCSEKKKNSPVSTELAAYLDFIVRKYWCKLFFTLAAQISEKFGRALFYRRQVATRGRKKRWEVNVIPIFEEDIEYDQETNTITKFRPIVRWGYGERQLYIAPENCILWLNERDPFGNSHQGKIALLSAYHSLRRTENIAESSTTIFNQRGQGYLMGVIEGADQETLDKYMKRFGNPSQYSVLFTDERFKLQWVEAMKSGYDLDKVLGTMSKEISKATGYPTNRMSGDNLGKTAGAETTQDNQAENYSTLQERYEFYMLESIKMLNTEEENRDLEVEPFAMNQDIEIKMDQQKRSNIFSTEAQAVNMVKAHITENQLRERIKSPLLDGPEGDLTALEYEAKLREDLAKKYPVGVNPSGSPQPGKPDGDTPPGDLPTNKEGKPQKPPQDPASYERRQMAEKLAKAGDSFPVVNAIIKKLCGGIGISSSTFNEVKKDLGIAEKNGETETGTES